MKTIRTVSFTMRCDLCDAKMAEIDGKTQSGPWAYMCPDCHRKRGVGLGIGRGLQLMIKETKEVSI